MNRNEYNRLVAERQKIVRENAGRRIKKLPPLPVPPKPEPPMGWELTDEEGIYAGFTTDEEEKDQYLAGDKRRKAKKKESMW